ncbi:phosphoadenosine phosphosulfate reductase [Cypionkella sp.]|uniref:phosphoadenosine phosphosulfate reductase n=1 Tax=Cypionkella sp. TaxID=2811411 RepID=UPI003752EAFF
MSETEVQTEPQLDPRASWAAKLEEMTAEVGYFHTLGSRHFGFFVDEGTTLLVTFENLSSVLANPDQLPRGYQQAKAKGWSLLTLIADGETWFRDPAVYAFFDRQVDDAFFEDFDRVLFYGSGMGGYAACAYSVAAPGSQVLALNPRATLDPSQTRWDTRSRRAGRLDFTSRYGYAPDMLEGCAHATVIHDPLIPAEAMQAALFRAPYITRLSARRLGDELEQHFVAMEILPKLIDQAMAASLSAQSFATLWRIRRNYLPYLKNLLAIAELAGRVGHERMICNSVTKRVRAPRFRKRLELLNSRQSNPETGAPSA